MPFWPIVDGWSDQSIVTLPSLSSQSEASPSFHNLHYSMRIRVEPEDSNAELRPGNPPEQQQPVPRRRSSSAFTHCKPLNAVLHQSCTWIVLSCVPWETIERYLLGKHLMSSFFYGSRFRLQSSHCVRIGVLFKQFLVGRTLKRLQLGRQSTILRLEVRDFCILCVTRKP